MVDSGQEAGMRECDPCSRGRAMASGHCHTVGIDRLLKILLLLLVCPSRGLELTPISQPQETGNIVGGGLVIRKGFLMSTGAQSRKARAR
jgi:hypothetical protein